MENKDDPHMTELFQSAHAVGVIIGRHKVQFPGTILNQPRWRGIANFSCHGERINPTGENENSDIINLNRSTFAYRQLLTTLRGVHGTLVE